MLQKDNCKEYSMSERDIYILGINAYDHDVSACLLKNGKIHTAISKERVTRIKHDMGFYQEPIDYCLKEAGIDLDRVDLVVRNCYILPVEKLDHRLAHHDEPQYLDDYERRQAIQSPLYLSTSKHVVPVSHHLAHAYSAFAVSPFDKGAVMIVDGVGNYRMDVTEPIPASDVSHDLARESESYYRFDDTKLETVKKVWMEPSPGLLSDEFYNMPGLGALYSRASSYIFGAWDKCGEVMGLAPFGRLEAMNPLLKYRDDENLEVYEWTADFRKPFFDDEEDWERSPNRPHWEDLARRVQEDLEAVLLRRANWLHEATGEKNLCIAGGVGLNCVANGRIVEETPFENVWIQPAAGDDGIAIGCAYYGHLAHKGQKRTFIMRDAYLGRPYAEEDIIETASKTYVRMYTTRKKSSDIISDTANLLVEGNVVGWFQGRSEFGPRALGNRSILADPRENEMKDLINDEVKHRQNFRPFAPAVLLERAHEIFEGDEESPYMLLVKKIRPEWVDRVAAIAHVDGTARVQTVRREDNPRYYDVIKAFGEMTGVPVLLNTSFNVRGEPIVEDPFDAMHCFLSTGIDVLVLHDLLVQKRLSYRLMTPVVKFAARFARNLRTEAWMHRVAKSMLKQ